MPDWLFWVLCWWGGSCLLTLAVFETFQSKRELKSPEMIIAWILVSPFWPLIAIWAIARVGREN